MCCLPTRALPALVFIFSLLPPACSNGTDRVCDPGTTQTCLCVGGGEGVQVCAAGGEGWETCQGCGAADSRGDDARITDVTEDQTAPADSVPADTSLPDAAGEDLAQPDLADDASAPDGSENDAVTPDIQPDTSCEPQCDGVECGDDGCGGLCNGCLDIGYDDGTTETAYGYSKEPDHHPTHLVCTVRFDLPQAGMKLTQFTAGWMYGLYNLQVPFRLAFATDDQVECTQGPDGVSWTEWCETGADSVTWIGDGEFLPKEPYTPMGADEMGDVTLPAKTIYLMAVFEITEYPFFTCPFDQSGDGTNAFLMSQHAAGDDTIIGGLSFLKKEENQGVIPFSIRVAE